jgi:hypothetical protein
LFHFSQRRKTDENERGVAIMSINTDYYYDSSYYAQQITKKQRPSVTLPMPGNEITADNGSEYALAVAGNGRATGEYTELPEKLTKYTYTNQIVDCVNAYEKSFWFDEADAQYAQYSA